MFTYPSPGIVGNRSIELSFSSYADGNAKWYFDDVTVIAGQEYIYSHKYTSTIQTTLTARFRSSDGNYSYMFLSRPAAMSNPTQLTVPILIPTGTISMTVWDSISQVGSLTLDDVSLILR